MNRPLGTILKETLLLCIWRGMWAKDFLNIMPRNYWSSYLKVAAAKSHQSCPTLCDPIDSSPPGSHPWDCPGKNTGVGCQFLLQCMKVKSESEVSKSCPTLRNPMDCSLPGSSVHGISQSRVLEWVAIGGTSYLWEIYIYILTYTLTPCNSNWCDSHLLVEYRHIMTCLILVALFFFFVLQFLESTWYIM